MAAGHYDENYGFEAMYIYQQSQAVYYNMVNTLKAKPYLDSALEIAKTNNRKGFIIRAYDELRKYYENIEQYKTALSYADSIRIVRIASIKEANTNYIYDHEIRYKKAEQDQQMTEMQAREEITQLNLSRKNTQLLLSGLGLIFALALIGGIYYFYRLKSNTNRLLTDKNEKLSTALNTNKMLVKEIHHRVKNNLQVVSSLLNLQGNYTEDEGILKAINTGRNRVQSMSLLHQNLYGNENLREIEINKYFTELTNSLIKEYPFSNGKQVDTHIDIDNLTIDIDTVVPLGLIVNELITNALKYAYKDQDNYALSVSVKELEVGKLSVTVADNGPGLPFDELPNETSSLGTQLIRSFVEKLDADISIDNSKGTKISLVIPLD